MCVHVRVYACMDGRLSSTGPSPTPSSLACPQSGPLSRHHKKALRAVAFHPRYPLFASGSDDGSVIVCHGMVYK